MATSRNDKFEPLFRRLPLSYLGLLLIVGMATAIGLIVLNDFSPDTLISNPSGLLQSTITIGLSIIALFLVFSNQRLLAQVAGDHEKSGGVNRQFNATSEDNEAMFSALNLTVILWRYHDNHPRLINHNDQIVGDHAKSIDLTQFSNWLEEANVAELHRRIAGLRDHGRPFCLEMKTRFNSVVKLDGLIFNNQFGMIIENIDSTHKLRNNLVLARDYHSHTLNLLSTAVAIFDRNHQLVSWNKAYRDLWKLDNNFLRSHPRDGDILDKLREAEMLPMQANYRSWQSKLLAIYNDTKTHEQVWHLPHGDVLRVIATPNSQGGATYIYENLTEHLTLEGKYKILAQVQRETLDQLTEAVVVFAPSGRLTLANHAFNDMWAVTGLAKRDSQPEPHISELIKSIANRFDNGSGQATAAPKFNVVEQWHRLKERITALDDARDMTIGQIARSDDKIIDYSLLPLPDGATMIVFRDVTNAVNARQMLKERNAALEAADQLKDAFLQTVSYELRTPLTNIIGFASLLASDGISAMTPTQRQYLDYINTSGRVLNTLINDILDLATVQAGVMQLDYQTLDIRKTIDSAINGVADRLQAKHLTITTNIERSLTTMVADKKRLRQILFNLLSNAVHFSREDGQITISCHRMADEIYFAIKDNGAGIATDLGHDNVWDAFTSRPSADGRRGAGLGLSIVKSFIELHDGAVDIASKPNQGVTASFTIPRKPHKARIDVSENHHDPLLTVTEKVA